MNSHDKPVFMAVSKPLLTEFGIYHRLESCGEFHTLVRRDDSFSHHDSGILEDMAVALWKTEIHHSMHIDIPSLLGFELSVLPTFANPDRTMNNVIVT